MALKQIGVGDKLGSYRLTQKLGQGGMGMVYDAIHEKLGKQVAIKILPLELSSDQTHVERFFREMKAVGQLEHRNIVSAYDAGEEDGTHYLAMECVDGIDLAKFVHLNGVLPASAACEIIRQAAQGLVAIDRAGLIHRDIKASNLILDRTGIVKILDLGLVRQLDSNHAELTPAGQGLGTVDYLAPEQGHSARTVDIRSDIYSLGCTLYKLITGQAPFSGPEFKSLPQKILAHINQPVPPFPENIQNVPERIFPIIKKMMEKSPDDRYQTPSEVIEVLTPFASSAKMKTLVEKIPSVRTSSPLKPDERSSVSLLDLNESTLDFSQANPINFNASLLNPTAQTRIQPAIEMVNTSAKETDRKSIVSQYALRIASSILLTAIVTLTIYHFGMRQPSRLPPNNLLPNHIATLPATTLPDSINTNQSQTAPHKVNLDNEIPFHWYKLLDQKPNPLIWTNKRGLANWQHNAGQQSLAVQADSEALFSLGKTSLKNFQYQIGLQQTNWSSGAGIFLGYKTEKTPDGGKRTTFQAFRTMVKTGEENQKLLIIRRLRGEISQTATGKPIANHVIVRSQLLPGYPAGELLFDLDIQNGRLSSFKVNGVVLKDLSEKPVNDQFQEGSFSGEFGTYTNSCSGNYQNAMFRKMAE